MCLFKTHSPAFSTLFSCPRKLLFTGAVLMTHIALVINKPPCSPASRLIQQRRATADWKEEEQRVLSFVPLTAPCRAASVTAPVKAELILWIPGATSLFSFP